MIQAIGGIGEQRQAEGFHDKEADEDDYEEYEEEDNGNFKVKGPRPISEAGGRYITGRKALAEAQAAEEERLAKRRAKNKKK